MMREVTIALAGNPNVGKSTVFNALTGMRQHVGNWPGKTVERKEGRLILGKHQITVVDLPGTYSLAARSPEEQIARDFIVRERPDAVVNVLDAANLERNLYLTAQLLEAEARLVLALNMADVAAARGLRLNPEALAAALGAPVVVMAASKGQGLDELKATLRDLVAASIRPAQPAFKEVAR
ncbi:MAG: FeoB small GTPase domain-containing protein [Oscillochloridaceae bacterium]|nr:FeoB small GTPase domain-containing protein [Oscillochloridaceae bacterium]